MKSIYYKLTVFFTVTLLCFALASCTAEKSDDNIWSEALYTEDTELGTGEKTVTVKVEAAEKSIVFTLHTDEEKLGDALTEYKLIEGENGAYGLYVKKVNGITADYDIDKTYWAITQNGENLMSGVDSITIADGDCYEWVRTEQ